VEIALTRRPERGRAALVRRLLLASGLVAGALVVSSNVPFFEELRRDGDFIGANTFTGLDEDALLSLLGRIELVAFAAGFAALASAGRALARRAPRFGWLFARPSVALAVFTIAIAVSTILSQSFEHAGKTHFTISDDAMITLRYARNVANGAGPVYDVGERVEGYTGPLWLVALSLIQLAGASVALAPLFVLVLSFACVLATVLLLEAPMRRFGASAAWIAATGVAVAADRDTVMWALSGLETSALTAVVTGCVFALATGRSRLFVVLLSVLPLVRSDAAVLAVSLGVLFVVLSTDRRNAVRWLAFASVPAALHLVFRLSYYGYPFPNTYYLKSLTWHDRLVTGFGGFGLRVVFLHAAALLGAIGALASSRAPRWLRGSVVVAFLQVAYGVVIGGDSFQSGRFYAPVLPIVTMACAFTLRALGRRAPWTAFGPALVAIGLSFSVFAPTGALGTHRPSGTFNAGNLETAELLQKNVPAGRLVSVSYAGTTPYYDPVHPFLDVLGKNDVHIAHAATYASLAVGHNRFDFDYVYDVRRPDVAIIHHDCEQVDRWRDFTRPQIAREASGSPRWVSPFGLYERTQPTFEKDYLPNRVHVVGVRDSDFFGCAFVREGSGLPMFWSATGTPEPLREVAFEVGQDAPEDRVVFDSSWSAATAADGRVARRTAARGQSNIDIWLQRSANVALRTCFGSREPVEVRINDVAVSMSREGDCGWGLVTRDVLQRRNTSTRLTVVGALVDVFSLSIHPR
jgi:hypothetical protein